MNKVNAEFYEAFDKGFTTTESCGPEKHFVLKTKFQSLADMQAAEKAFFAVAEDGAEDK